jgi:hypothetical protein
LIIALVFLTVVLFLMYVLFLEIKKQQKVKNKYYKKQRLQTQSKQTIDTALNKRLLTLLNGDEQAVLRLIGNVRKNNPGKSYT